MNIKNEAIALSIFSLILSSNTFATNGYFTHGLGVKNKGLAGAGTAAPTEAIAAANNPASAMVVGDTGIEAGISFFSPDRAYSASQSACLLYTSPSPRDS